MQTTRSDFFIICLLGALSIISPFAIDMYLPAFNKLADEYQVTTTTISLTVSSYFIGMAFGQILYGPLLDRYGRKTPLLCGLAIFILASLGCVFAPNVESLIALRFIQALGGCAAGVASLAIVRDFFGAEQSAKILSLLFLFIALSPLLAPSIGGYTAIKIGWRSVFLILAVLALVVALITHFLMPETHRQDKGISLKPLPIILEYVSIFRHPSFFTFSMAGAFSFAGLFTYVAGSPIIFMDGFKLSPEAYSAVFAGLAVGFIGGSQLNMWLLRKMTSQYLFFRVLILQAVIGVIFAVMAWSGTMTLPVTLVLFFLFLACAGITYPNAAALAITPFSRNAGSASALLGFIQLGLGSIISTGISMSKSSSSFPIMALLAITSVAGLLLLAVNRKKAEAGLADQGL